MVNKSRLLSATLGVVWAMISVAATADEAKSVAVGLPHARPPILEKVKTPKLTQHFRDDGGVQATCQIDSDSWCEIGFDLQTKLGAENDTLVTLELSLPDSDNATIRLEQREEVGGFSWDVSLGASQKNGNSERLEFAGRLPSGCWELTYRWGLVKLLSPDGKSWYQKVSNGISDVDELGIIHSAKNVAIKIVNVRRLPRVVFKPEQVSAILHANELSRQFFATYQAGDYAKSKQLGERIVDFRNTRVGRFDSNTATAYQNLASIYMKLGELESAEKALQHAVAIRQAVQGDEHPDSASTRVTLASLLKKRGAYQDAIELYQAAKTTTENVASEKRASRVARINNDLADAFHYVSLYGKAEPLYTAAINGYRAAGHVASQATSLNNLGDLYLDTDRLEQAEAAYREALRLREAIFLPEINLASSLNGLGCLNARRGDLPAAIQQFKRLLSIRENAIGKNNLSYITSLRNLAETYRLNRDWANSRDTLKNALAIAREQLGERHDTVGSLLHGLGIAEREMKRFDDASTSTFDSLSLLSDSAYDLSHFMDESDQRSYRSQFAFRLNSALLLALESHEQVDRAYEAAMNWKGATLIQQRRYRDLAQQAGLADDLQTLTETSQTLYRHLATRDDSASWNAKYTQLIEQRGALESGIAKQSESFSVRPTQITRSQLSDALGTDTVLVDFYPVQKWKYAESGDVRGEYFDRHLVAFVVRADSKTQLLDLGDYESIARAIDAWRMPMAQAQVSAGSRKQTQDAANKLRERLWLPIESALGGAKTVVVSPDGPLGKLPFAALPGKAPDTYLIDTYQIAVVPLPRWIITATQPDAPAPEQPTNPVALLVGDVDYSAGLQDRNESTSKWAQLAATRQEIDSVEKSLRKSNTYANAKLTKLTTAQAKKSEIARQAPMCNLLHFATHGFFKNPQQETQAGTSRPVFSSDRMVTNDKKRFSTVDRSNPGLLSGLVFAGANDPIAGEDGVMTAEEISYLALNSVDLVTLSACETGLGLEAGGEGLIGIQRAFQIAGAKSTVSSLWNVDDAATAVLMQRFYENRFDRGMTKLNSLIEAQRWILDAKDSEAIGDRGSLRIPKTDNPNMPPSKRPHPRYWAAWLLSGDWR